MIHLSGIFYAIYAPRCYFRLMNLWFPAHSLPLYGKVRVSLPFYLKRKYVWRRDWNTISAPSVIGELIFLASITDREKWVGRQFKSHERNLS